MNNYEMNSVNVSLFRFNFWLNKKKKYFGSVHQYTL